MFRTISRQLTRNNAVFIPTKGIMQALQRKRPGELNSVKLMGTIEHEVTRLRNGGIKLYLKTTNEDTSYCVHKIAIANRNLLNMMGNQLAVNQRIYVGGRLKTTNILIENERHQEVEVLANELYFLEANPKLTEGTQGETKPVQLDENKVEMLAFIGTEVRNERNLSAFSIATHFTKHKGTLDESEGKEYHRVLIYNIPEMIQVARNLNKFDRVYVTGYINYITKTYPDGKDYSKGYIQPTNLVKLRKFDRD